MKMKSKSLSRMGFEKNEKGQIVRKAGVKVKRKNYNPKAKLTGTPKTITVNNNDVSVTEHSIRINIKPISVNDAWQGRRFRTPYYDQFEEAMMRLLPNIILPEPPYRVYFKWGFSNVLSDLDNPGKVTTDCLQKRYGFNDKLIHRMVYDKIIVKKGEEFIEFSIRTFNPAEEIIF